MSRSGNVGFRVFTEIPRPTREVVSELAKIETTFLSDAMTRFGGMGANNRLVPIGTPVNTVFVVKGHVIGPGAPPDILRGCQQLAALARIGLLGVEFASGSAGPWTFVGATPLPDLHLGGQALLDTLASVMQDQTRNCR